MPLASLVLAWVAQSSHSTQWVRVLSGLGSEGYLAFHAAIWVA